ncbi:hypothetical protein F2P56_019637 [Juglans regia]|uniref:Transcription factor MYB106-like n=2 Tax=Juglans regia TaxID=51240 RepID=A0A833XAB4_JUGRE|nr:transcription factor MYB106-like [Juglans regia]KAF5459715.1 hypothetical protein F2P56_019637 [Juglans regia]
MGRTPCCNADGMNRGPWTPEEDQKLLAYIQHYGCGSWLCLPRKAGLQRCGKSCRLRWNNYLRPDIKRGQFSLLEDRTIIQLHALLGSRWSAIATHLPKRTDNEIKNYWNTHLKKRLAMMGIDPVTHKPKGTVLESANGDPKSASNLSHMAQWENTRLEAEERLVRESQLCYQLYDLPPGFSSGRSSAAASGMLLNETTTSKLAPPRCLDVLKVWESVMLESMLAAGNDHHGGVDSGSVFGLGMGGNSDIASGVSALGFLEINARDHQTYSNEFNEISTMQLHKMNLATGDVGDRQHHHDHDGVFNNLGNYILSANSLIAGSTGSGSSNAVEERARNETNYWHDIINTGSY